MIVLELWRFVLIEFPPEVPGRVDPLGASNSGVLWLSEERREEYAKVIGVPKQRHLWNPVPKNCNNITAENEIILARKLVASGMGSFMPDSAILKSLYPHPKHIIAASHMVDAVGLSPVLEAGWFAVANKAEADRLI